MEKDGPAFKFRVMCVDHVAVGKIVVVLPAVQRVFGFCYRSVFHHTAANSAARIRTMETAAVISDLMPIVLAECDLEETNRYLIKHENGLTSETS